MAEFADLVLPAGIWGEKEGTYTNSERRISKVNAFAKPPGEARADFDIFLALADQLGVRGGVLSRLDHNARGLAAVAARLRRPPLRPQPVHLAQNRRGGRRAVGRRAPLRPTASSPRDNGRTLFHCVPCLPFVEQPDLILNTGRTVEHWHTRTKTGAVPMLHGMAPNTWLKMNPADAGRLSLRQHDRVTIVSRRNRLFQAAHRLFRRGLRRVRRLRSRCAADAARVFALLDQAVGPGGRARCCLPHARAGQTGKGVLGNVLVATTVIAAKNVIIGPAPSNLRNLNRPPTDFLQVAMVD